MLLRATHTYAVLELSDAAFEEIASKLRSANYDSAFMEGGVINMNGIGISKVKDDYRTVSPHEIRRRSDWMADHLKDPLGR